MGICVLSVPCRCGKGGLRGRAVPRRADMGPGGSFLYPSVHHGMVLRRRRKHLFNGLLQP